MDGRRLSVMRTLQEGKKMSDKLKLLHEKMEMAREEDLAFYKQ